MPRLPGKLVGIALAAPILVHVALVAAGSHAGWFRPDQWQQNAVWLALSLGVALVGRLLLSFLPPGPAGAHDLRHLPETWATSLGLGWLAVAVGYFPVAHLWLVQASGSAPAAPELVYAAPAALLALLALARWITLPGAMVPRHEVERASRGWPRWLPAAVVLGWLGHALLTRAFVAALAWVVLAIALERALARARRAAAGRALFLCALATLGNPGQGAESNLFGLLSELGVAAALGLGAACLVPWLRRADRRAGVLAALFFGSVALAGPYPLALAGPLVLVLSSHRAQRRFALLAAAGAALPCAALGLLAYPPPRGRPLIAGELLARALELDAWGIAWPLVAAALALGTLTFPWRAAPWTPGTIEEPRREVLALAALLVLAAAALCLPVSPWFEQQALVILFPLAALLAGQLLIPAEPPAARGGA